MLHQQSLLSVVPNLCTSLSSRSEPSLVVARGLRFSQKFLNVKGAGGKRKRLQLSERASEIGRVLVLRHFSSLLPITERERESESGQQLIRVRQAGEKPSLLQGVVIPSL